jgi:hypothetical protein
MLVFSSNGSAGITGTLKGMTAAKGLDTNVLNIPPEATHYFHYYGGVTAYITAGEKITQETSGATAHVVAIVRDNGATGTSDVEGIMFINSISGTPSAALKTWTGAVSTGVVTSISAPLELRVRGQAKTVLISCETAAVNYTLNGSPPTATAGTNLGHKIAVGEWLSIEDGLNIRGFQAINAVNASGSVLKYTLFY